MGRSEKVKYLTEVRSTVEDEGKREKRKDENGRGEIKEKRGGEERAREGG